MPANANIYLSSFFLGGTFQSVFVSESPFPKTDNTGLARAAGYWNAAVNPGCTVGCVLTTEEKRWKLAATAEDSFTLKAKNKTALNHFYFLSENSLFLVIKPKAFISLSSLAWGKCLVPCTRMRSCAHANDTKVMHSRDAQCNADESPYRVKVSKETVVLRRWG